MKLRKKIPGKWIRILGILLLMLLVAGPGYYRFNQVRPLEYISGFYQGTDHLPDLYEFNFTKDQAFFRFNGEIRTSGGYFKAGDHVYLCRFGQEDLLITLDNEGFHYYDKATGRVIRLLKKSAIPQSVPGEKLFRP